MRVIHLVLRGLTWNSVLAFLDDVLVLGKDFDDHLENLREVFKRFRQYQLKLKPKKCVLFQKEVEFLGRKVSQDGLEIGKGYLEPVVEWPVPQNTKEVERFLGFCELSSLIRERFCRNSCTLV